MINNSTSNRKLQRMYSLCVMRESVERRAVRRLGRAAFSGTRSASGALRRAKASPTSTHTRCCASVPSHHMRRALITDGRADADQLSHARQLPISRQPSQAPPGPDRRMCVLVHRVSASPLLGWRRGGDGGRGVCSLRPILASHVGMFWPRRFSDYFIL